MILVYVVCEGQSENAFVREILNPYISEKTEGNVYLIPTTLITSRNRRSGVVYRGGLTGYEKAKNDITNFLKSGYFVTTMFDFYALPKDFPGVKDAEKLQNDIDKVNCLEKALFEDIKKFEGDFDDNRFIPYIQLHEFEALFYTNLSALKKLYVSRSERKSLDKLIEVTENMSPEEIDQGEETAPSKRLNRAVNYKKGKAVVFPLKEIGIDNMRNACPHFNSWVECVLCL